MISVFPLVALVGLFLFRYHFFPQYWLLIQEDAFFEWIQFVGYFNASVLFILHAWRLKRWPGWMRALLFLGGISLFFIAGEEISWGQRIFHIQNPEYFVERNIQKELSIHNLDFFQWALHAMYIIVCLLLTIAQPLLISLFHLTRKTKGIQRFIGYLKELAPRWYLGTYFFPVSVFYSLFVFWRPFGAVMRNGVLLMVGRDQEVFETLMAMGIMLTAILFRNRGKSKHALYYKK